MGKAWDYAVPSVETWRECLRVLKPGAPLLSFGGTRTFHRIATNLEDAGFELRDTLCWLYGQGFPKSHNVSKALDRKAGATREVIGTRTLSGTAALTTQEKGGTYSAAISGAGRSVEVAITAPSTPGAQAWEGYGSALKPGWEPIILARKPLDGTMAENATSWGTGPLNIDGCRIGRAPDDASGWSGSGSKASANVAMSGANYARGPKPDAPGRWPANVALSHTADCVLVGTRDVSTGTAVHRHGVNYDGILGKVGTYPPGTPDRTYGVHGKETIEAWECADDCPVRMLDAQSGNRPSSPFRENVATGDVLPLSKRTAGGYSDSGGASRFFYCAKVGSKERNLGLDGFEPKDRGAGALRGRPGGGGLDGGNQAPKSKNAHPTMKPIALTTWLATLILPPNPGKLLVPFSGVGSEVIGALLAGWTDVVGIEQSSEYVEIAQARIEAWRKKAA